MRVESGIRAYAAAVGFTCIAVGLKLLLIPLVGHDTPFTLLLVPVVLSAWHGGLMPGLVATALAALAAGTLFVPGEEHGMLPGLSGVWQVMVFVLEGSFVAILAAARDRAQAQTRAALARESEVLESITDAFLAFDPEFQITYVNEPARRLLDCKPAAGCTLWDVFPSMAGTVFETQFRRAMSWRVSVRFDGYDAPTGRWYDAHAYPTANGGLALYLRDVTEWKREEERALQLAAIVESTDAAIFSKSLDGALLTWNEAATRMYGYTAEEAIGKPVSMLAPPEKMEEVAGILEKLRRGEQIHTETVRRRKNGAIFPVSLVVSPIRDREGKVAAASVIARDITERRELERRMLETQKLESLGVLAGGIAHDFNNLLTGILGNASLALEGASDPLVRGALENIIRGSERAADLTGQILAYSGRGRFVILPVDISEAVRKMTGLLQSSLPANVALDMRLKEGLPPIEADPSRIEQLVLNLVTNAGEAIGEKAGIVTVSTGNGTEGGARRVWLEVRDTGSGMDENTRARIFDPFFSTKFTGRGLGLAAVSGIVRSHGGTIAVFTEPGHGSTFRICFPPRGER